MFKEFKKFILRGNVMDLAVGMIIGAAFNKIVSSVVNDLFMPLLTMVTGNTSYKAMFISLDGIKYDSIEAAVAANAATINYGLFISYVIDFLTMAVVLFLIIRTTNKLSEKLVPKTEKDTPTEVTTKECSFCYSTINIKATKCPSCTADLT